MSARRRLSLELEEWSTRPVGQIVDEDGRAVEFDGWLGLASALECIWEGGRPVPAIEHHLPA